MEWQLLLPQSWATTQPRIERLPASALELRITGELIDCAVRRRAASRRVTTKDCAYCQSNLYSARPTVCPACSETTEALERRKLNDAWLEERRVVREHGIEYSSPAGSRILAVR